MLGQLLEETSAPTPASSPTHAATQRTKHSESLLQEASIAVLLAMGFCHSQLQRAVSPAGDGCDLPALINAAEPPKWPVTLHVPMAPTHSLAESWP